MTGQRILIVEDEHLVADALRRALTVWGADVVAMAPSVERGLAALEATPNLDGALLDINLRGVGAWAVADALIARRVPFVFTTGYDEPMIPDAYHHVPVLKKPFDPDVLLGILFPGRTG